MLLRRYHNKKEADVVAEAAKEAEEAANEEAADIVAAEEMTVAELKAYAAENNIDLGEATKKADILAAIKNA